MRSDSRPLTLKNILFYYIPMLSLFFYMILALKLTSPEFPNDFESWEEILYLFCGNLFGFTLYIYGRRHLKAFTARKKITTSVSMSAMFMVKSWIIIAMARGTLAKESSISVALVTGAVMLIAEYKYLK